MALLAILSDAFFGHMLAWENDPYWTYWITKTFLIATVFGLGTAWLGVGVGRGAVITAVHTIVLTVYYWSLSPIGLPSHPDWLDLEHTWLTGLPIHFGVIYLGYLAALWLWRRRTTEGTAIPAGFATAVLAVGAGMVVLSGVLEALAIDEFQGVTWYVVRLLIAVPFVMAWVGLAGRDFASALAGAIVLTAILASYSHFLGPVGLPDIPLRIFEAQAPGATVHWLGYRQEALIATPITLLITLAGLILLSRMTGGQWRPASRRAWLGLGVGAVVLVLAGALIAPGVGPDADRATVTASGAVTVERGAWFSGNADAGTGELRLAVVNRNPRVTPLPPHDTVDLTATIRRPNGPTYSIRATQPMVDDPMGRFTTWWGVGMDVWHHGRSGIGAPQVPPMHSQVAVFALGELSRDGQQIATGVPIHAMTLPDGTAELDVGDPQAPPIPGLEDGHLRIAFAQAGVESHTGKPQRYLFGLLALIAALALAAAGLRGTRNPDRA